MTRIEELDLAIEEALRNLQRLMVEKADLVALGEWATRHPEQVVRDLTHIGDMRIDVGEHRFYKGDVEQKVTKTEWDLIEYFLRYPNILLEYNRILSAVWGAGYRTEHQYLRVWVARIRKLGLNIESRSKMGYRLIV